MIRVATIPPFCNTAAELVTSQGKASARTSYSSARREAVSAAIGEVKEAALIGGLLAVLVLYCFLRDARMTLISGVAIPVSVVGTFVNASP